MKKNLNTKTLTTFQQFSKDMECLNALEKVTEPAITALMANMQDFMDDLNINKNSKLHIVCVGIYNAGKSTLLNILSETENFPVGVIPTTDALDQFETEDCIYIDTPGLNAKTSDDTTAIQSFRDADVILFVSNIQNGGLNRAEAEYLDILSDILGGKDTLLKQTIFLLSHASQTEHVEKVINEHKKLLNKQLGNKPEIVLAYDSATYHDGRETNNDKLIEESNIQALLNILDEKKSFIREHKAAMWNERLEEKEKKVCDSLEGILSGVEQRIADLEKKKAEKGIDSDKLKKAIASCKKIIGKAKDEIKIPEKGYWEITDRGAPFLGFSNKYIKENSEYAAKRRIKELLERPYNRRERAVRDHAQTVAKEIAKYYLYEHTPGNYYFDCCQAATTSLLQCNDTLTNVGVYLPKEVLEEIQIIPKLEAKSESAIVQDLCWRVVEYGDFYSLNYYVDDVDITDSEECVGEGLFGGLKYKTIYYVYELYNEVCKMVEDLSYFDQNLKSEWNPVERALESFTTELKQTLDERLNQIIETAAKAESDSAKDVKTELKNYTACKDILLTYLI